MALESVVRNQGEDLFQLPLVIDVFGKDVFVQRVPRRTVDEQNVSLQRRSRQLAEKIPAPLPLGWRAGAFLELGPRPKNRPLGPRIEALGVEQGPWSWLPSRHSWHFMISSMTSRGLGP